MRHDARIDRVGAALRRQRAANITIAVQDVDDPTKYTGIGLATYTLAELDELAAGGRQVVRIDYQSQPIAPGTKVIHFDDVFGGTDAGDEPTE